MRRYGHLDMFEQIDLSHKASSAHTIRNALRAKENNSENQTTRRRVGKPIR